MLVYPPSYTHMPLGPHTGSPHVTPISSPAYPRSLEDLGNEVARQFAYPCVVRRMLAMSNAMLSQYRRQLKDSQACMLPSFCHTLPSGQECGTYLALDVGGSTLRVALVELHGRAAREGATKIKRMTAHKIDESVRKLPSTQFFDWMATRIQSTLQEEKLGHADGPVMPVGLAWSFPIEQTSTRGGRAQGMGKGFICSQEIVGQNLEDLIEDACARRGLRVRVDAIVNDSSATLLSRAYADPSTSMSLIVGTGTNAAVHLPTSCMGKSKFGQRDPSWFHKAERVITNTELSMFGKGILPETRWDERLNLNHTLPDFQPLEYMATGRYLGEILRLIIIEAVEAAGLFHGVMPLRLQEQYSLDTAILAKLEADRSSGLGDSANMIQSEFGLPHSPSRTEMSFLRLIVEAISHRAAAYLAVAIHALWALQKDTEINPTTPHGTPKTSIACDGSVVLKYPGFKARTEEYIAEMISAGSSSGGIFTSEKVVLQPADDAAILGAAVAVALAENPDQLQPPQAAILAYQNPSRYRSRAGQALTDEHLQMRRP